MSDRRTFWGRFCVRHLVLLRISQQWLFIFPVQCCFGRFGASLCLRGPFGVWWCAKSTMASFITTLQFLRPSASGPSVCLVHVYFGRGRSSMFCTRPYVSSLWAGRVRKRCGENSTRAAPNHLNRLNLCSDENTARNSAKENGGSYLLGNF